MLRRLETYGFHPATTPEQIDDLARVLRRTGWFIPEVLDSAVGRNRSSAGVDLVWEHSYESPEAYARYMCQPVPHLHPRPVSAAGGTRVHHRVAPRADARADGLRDRRRALPARRRDPSHRRAQGARPGDFDAFARRRSRRGPASRVSVVAPNTMGLEWFPTGWTHIWEQAFDDDDAMQAATADEADVLARGPVTEWIDIHYVIDREASPTETVR